MSGPSGGSHSVRTMLNEAAHTIINASYLMAVAWNKIYILHFRVWRNTRGDAYRRETFRGFPNLTTINSFHDPWWVVEINVYKLSIITLRIAINHASRKINLFYFIYRKWYKIFQLVIYAEVIKVHTSKDTGEGQFNLIKYNLWYLSVLLHFWGGGISFSKYKFTIIPTLCSFS